MVNNMMTMTTTTTAVTTTAVTTNAAVAVFDNTVAVTAAGRFSSMHDNNANVQSVPFSGATKCRSLHRYAQVADVDVF